MARLFTFLWVHCWLFSYRSHNEYKISLSGFLLTSPPYRFLLLPLFPSPFPFISVRFTPGHSFIDSPLEDRFFRFYMFLYVFFFKRSFRTVRASFIPTFRFIFSEYFFLLWCLRNVWLKLKKPLAFSILSSCPILLDGRIRFISFFSCAFKIMRTS